MTPEPARARDETVDLRPSNWVGSDDPTVIEACLRGDETAWRELVTRYQRLVFSIPRRYGFDGESSDDIFQEVFAIVLRKLADVENRQGFAKWLITTTHRVCGQRRRRQRRTVGDAVEAIGAPEPAADLSVEWERAQAVRHGLRRLGGPCEALLNALYSTHADTSYDRVADHLGIPVGSIGPTRARCLKKLQEILRADGFPEED